MGKRLATVQSSYIPWKGYFDLINMADEFVLFDDVQFTKNDWRNRNRIKTRDGVKWITIPIRHRFPQKIKDTVISYSGWNVKHWKTIVQNYSRAKYFPDYRELFEDLYLGCKGTHLSEINHRFITAICEMLGVQTTISWSMDYRLIDGKTERLVDLCRQAGAEEYISGPSAQGYMNEELFRNEGITVRYIDYSGYPEYDQLFPPFDHQVSIIDLILNEGPDAPKFMKSF